MPRTSSIFVYTGPLLFSHRIDGDGTNIEPIAFGSRGGTSTHRQTHSVLLNPPQWPFRCRWNNGFPPLPKCQHHLLSLHFPKKKKRSKFLPAKPSCPCRCTKHMRSLYLHCLRTWIPRLFTETQTTLLGDECQAVLCASSRQHTPREHGLICLFLSGNTVKYGV